MPDEVIHFPSPDDFDLAAVHLLLRLLGEEAGDRRVVPARMLDEYGSGQTDRERIAALAHVYLHDNVSREHPLYHWLIRYYAASQTFVATPLPG